MKRTYQKPIMEVDDKILVPQMICGSGGASGGSIGFSGGSGSAGGGR